jgi:lactate permease
MVWSHVYDPLGSQLLSTLVALVPLVILLGLLAFAGWAAHWAALAGLTAALAIAIGVVGMPADAAAAATLHGAAFGLFPIGWIIVTAMFLYRLCVEAGALDVMKRSVMGLSADHRLQALLIAFCFGAFLEGAAGFGAPVAISAALMTGAGFPPLEAACLALIANTAPVAFGALGTPIITLAKVTGLDEQAISALAGRQLPFFSLIVPAWMVATMAGWRGLVGVWPAVLVCGATFSAVQFVMANYVGAALVDVVGGVVSLGALALFLRLWRPRVVWRHGAGWCADWVNSPSALNSPKSPAGGTCSPPADFDNAGSMGVVSERCQSKFTGGCARPPAGSLNAGGGGAVDLGESGSSDSAGRVFWAWMPWAFLSLAMLCQGLPVVKGVLEGRGAAALLPAGVVAPEWRVPWLDGRIAKVPPAVRGEPEIERAVYRLNWLSAAGTGILVAAIVSVPWLGIPWRRAAVIWGHTLFSLAPSLATIAAMLALAFVTRYSGTDVTLGLALTNTGPFYAFFAPLLGWLGVALTGSDTSSNAMFGSLQRVTAEQLGLDPLLTCTANSTGGVMGKMIDAQSIVVSATATGTHRQEGAILRRVFPHSLALALLMGLLVWLQSGPLAWMVPRG